MNVFMNKCFFYIAILSVLPAAIVLGQGGMADSLSLNSYWNFKTDPDNAGEEKQWYRAGLDDASWETMKVPSNWDTHNQYAHYAGKAWYRKNIEVPAGWKDKLVRILFEAVYHDCKVWVNGQLLGDSRSGFLPVEFDLSSLLNYGGQNTIVVCADNSFRRGALWNWGGIRRPVFVVASHPVIVANQLIAPVIDLKNKSAVVTIKVLLKNAGKEEEAIKGDIVLSAPNGFRRVLPFTQTIPAGSTKEVSLTTSLTGAAVHLWSCDDPFLYQSEVQLRSATGSLHARKDRFGLRKIEVDNTNYEFRLNGEPVRMLGFNLVPDDRTTGNTLPLWRIKEDIDLMKGLGGNMARLSHLPLPKEAMDYLDESGIMVFDEVPLWGFDALADKRKELPRVWLQQLMNRDYNHPCVIGWSVGNEIGQYPAVMEYVEDAIDYVHKTDSLHLGVMVSHTADRGDDPLRFSDMGLINGYGTGIGTRADKIHTLHPGKVLFYTEYGYGQLGEELNTDVNAKAMVDSIRNKPYLIGGSLWTFNDYRSGFYGTKESSENRPWGIVDVFRQKKRAYFSFRKEYSPLRNVQVTQLTTATKATATLVITPRQQLDLPAFTMRNYLLVWKAIDTMQRIIDGGFIRLPVIQPGDKALSYPIQWKGSTNMAALQIEVISPLQYTVYDTLVNLQKPALPEIVYATGVRTDMNNLPANSGSIRIVFKQDPLTKGYKVRYGKNGLTEETVPTIDHYIDIPKLAVHETYQYQLVAINDAGETVSPVHAVKIGFGLAPPVVYYTEPADSGFFVGYATQFDDYLFRIQYTTTKGDYTNARMLQTQTKGVLFVPGLTNGKTYYYRLQRVKQNTFESDWSEEIAVTPDGNQVPTPPVLHGMLKQKNGALLFFEPVKKATGYHVQYRSGTGNWKDLYINKAVVNQVFITDMKKGEPVECRMASLSSAGRSGFSGVLTVN